MSEKVTIKYLGEFRNFAARTEEEVLLDPEASTVRTLMKKLGDAHGPQFRRRLFDSAGEILSHVMVMLNSRHLPFEEYATTTVKEGDLIFIGEAIAGGDRWCPIFA